MLRRISLIIFVAILAWLVNHHRSSRRSVTHLARTMEDVNAASGGSIKAESETLPKLSPAEFRLYNHMAENMEYYVRFILRVRSMSLLTDVNSTVISEALGK